MEWLLGALVLGSIVYSVLAVVAARHYLAGRSPRQDGPPPGVSILKPLAGAEDGLEENLRSFFAQDYPDFEILFAVRHADDAAVPVVRQLQVEYPAIPSRLILTGEPPYPNAKVWSLAKMAEAAKHELLVMSDSDVRVTPEMLRVVAGEFADPGVGMATCPYRAVAGPSLWSELEATGMNTDFWSGVLTARMLEGMKFAVGPTIAARKQVIADLGGFSRVSEYLAEDFVLGKFAAEAGHKVILSRYVIEHRIGSAALGRSLGHRLRWVRSTRRSRPWGYVGQLFTMPVPLAALLLAADGLSPAPWWPLVVTAAVMRFAAAWMVSRQVLGSRISWALLPLEDFLAFAVWIAGFFGRTIRWRDRTYLLLEGGRMRRVA
jgi:ceramide glucosyltransferase